MDHKSKTNLLVIEWKPEWFSLTSFRGHWRQQENQKEFLNSIAKKLNVQKPSDWGNISKSQINKSGGSSLLKHYGESIPKMLKSIFPGNNSLMHNCDRNTLETRMV